jgi:hypothetical protein
VLNELPIAANSSTDQAEPILTNERTDKVDASVNVPKIDVWKHDDVLIIPVILNELPNLIKLRTDNELPSAPKSHVETDPPLRTKLLTDSEEPIENAS